MHINTLRPKQDGRHFPDDIFKWIFLNEIMWISTKISLKFVPSSPINNIPALVQIMAWRRPGDKPLSEPMMVSLLTHICVIRPQWIKLLLWVALHLISLANLLTQDCPDKQWHHICALEILCEENPVIGQSCIFSAHRVQDIFHLLKL